MTPLEFFNTLWGAKPADQYILIWIRDGKESHWFREVTAAAKFVSNHDRDVYVGVGLSHREYGLYNRCPSEDVTGISGLWADFDLHSDAHAKPLPATVEEALSLIPDEFPPTIIIVTGNGIHAWWLFNKPWIFANDGERKDAAGLSFRFQTFLRCKSNQRGWTFERLSDLARVLRIPGTLNAKDGKNPKPVELHSLGIRHYDPSEFRQYLDKLVIPDSEAEDRAGKDFAERFADHPLVINQDADIPDDTLAQWMRADTRFGNTWKRQRDDLHDQSQSGYDQALAHFGVSAGLTDQQIVDLIVQHRRVHGQERRTRVDHFQRAISKARKSAEPMCLSACGPASAPFPPGDGSSSMADTGVGNVAKKALLCQQIGEILGVRLLRLVKLGGSDPVYLMELEEGVINFPDVGKFISQRAVGLALAARVGKVIRKFTANEWRQLSQMFLDACTTEEGTDDLEYKGVTRIYLTQYLADSQIISSLAGEVGPGLRKPMIHDGKIAISAIGFQMFINQTMMQSLSVKAVAAMMMALGAKSVRVREKGLKEQSRWALPIAEFDPKDYQRHQEGDGGTE